MIVPHYGDRVTIDIDPQTRSWMRTRGIKEDGVAAFLADTITQARQDEQDTVSYASTVAAWMRDDERAYDYLAGTFDDTDWACFQTFVERLAAVVVGWKFGDGDIDTNVLHTLINALVVSGQAQDPVIEPLVFADVVAFAQGGGQTRTSVHTKARLMLIQDLVAGDAGLETFVAAVLESGVTP